VSLERFSTCEQSGWRPRAEKRIQGLKDIFRAGQFGLSCACTVQILELKDVDGCSLIDDGVSTVLALQGLKEEHALHGAIIEDTTLLNIFDHGLHVTVVKYPDDDNRTLRRAWNAGKHDDDNNTIRHTSVHLKISVAKEMYATIDDWGLIAKDLVKKFNLSESSVRRWTRCAKGMDASVLEFLGREDNELIKGVFIWGNEYFMGVGVKTRTKLGPSFAVAALQILVENKPK